MRTVSLCCSERGHRAPTKPRSSDPEEWFTLLFRLLIAWSDHAVTYLDLPSTSVHADNKEGY